MLSFDPFSERYFDDPFPIYAQLRDEAPALYLEEYDCFFLSRFQDVWDAVSNPAFSHRRGTTSMELLLGNTDLHRRALSGLVPPEHTALRKTLAPAFGPSATRRLEAEAQALAAGFLAERLEAGELDAISDLALRLSVRVAFRILGLPLSDADSVAVQVGQTFDRQLGTRGNTDTGRGATVDLREYLGECVDARRKRGGNADLIDTLLAFRWEGRALPPEEVVSNLYLMVIGGTETLPKVFAGALYQLWRHPEQRAEVAANPDLAADAFWEALRYEMPTLMLGATADKDTTICGGTPVRAGQKVMHLWCSANRDEREFPEPERFDIRRRAPRILSFNHARHRCLGAHIAQMEGRVLLREVLSRIPDYEIDEAHALRIRSEFFRGFSSLPIRFEARRAG